MQDEDWLIRLKQGDPGAFTELVSAYKDIVLNTCYRFLLNREDAADAAQEVFLEVYRSVARFKGDARLSTWIYRIAVTKCLDEIKKRKRKKRISSIGQLLHLDDVAAFLTGGRRADSDLIEKEALSAIYHALDRLPDNQRAAFTLSKIEGYSNAEIAAILDTTQVAVESLIHRARTNLRKYLEPK